jgi:predicted membrane protein
MSLQKESSQREFLDGIAYTVNRIRRYARHCLVITVSYCISIGLSSFTILASPALAVEEHPRFARVQARITDKFPHLFVEIIVFVPSSGLPLLR